MIRWSFRPALALLIVGAAGLAGFSATYWLTRAHPPTIRVRWRDDVSIERQGELARRYLLVEKRAQHPDAPQSFAYDLLDTRPANVEALVRDPEVADTNDVDRDEYRIRPGAAHGEGWMWAVHRTPGLRDVTVRWAVVIALALVALAGLEGVVVFWLAPVSRPALRWLRTLDDHGDLFDRLGASPPSSSEPLAFAKKAIAACLVAVAIGLPVLATWEAILLAACLLALVCAVPIRGWARLAMAAGVVLAVLGVKAILPRADLAEAHNAFLVIRDGEALERGLPPEIFRSWRAQFEALYPASKETPSDYSWRTQGPVPARLITASSDAIWRPAKYTRQVDAIEFHTLGEFRGGFANENEYNFWTGSLRREAMPFYVMYELTPASVGSALAWTGQLFWERADGHFDEVVHRGVSPRRIEAEDAGRRVYAVFFPEREQPYFRFEPSWALQLAAMARGALSLLGAVTIVLAAMRVRRGAYLRALTLFAIGYLVMVLYYPMRTEYLGPSYPPQSGGDDGLVHDGRGRMMAMLAGRGEVGEALKGLEPVYWFTPGTRYVRMVEKLVFGDTNLLFALQLACFPIVIFYLIRPLLGVGWAWVMTVVFLLLPVGNFSFLQYVTYARVGYGETWGSALFLGGVVLLLRTQPRWGGSDKSKALIWCAGAALAGSMFIRPNFALAVVWLGGAYAWASWKSGEWGRVVILAAGLAMALWMPLHNWTYGGEFYLISKSGATLSVPIGIGDYMSAIGAVLRGDVHTPETGLVAAQLKGWLLDPGFVGNNAAVWAEVPAHAVRLVALIATLWIALKWLAGGLAGNASLGVIAVAALMAHVPLLFVFSTYYRYAVLAWDLSLLVLVVALVRWPLPRPRTVLSPLQALSAGGER